jgi:peptidoglycan/LPS O-acetylase OafA/YrhL
VVVAVLIVGLVTSPPRLLSLILEQPALVWAGRISYGLYLWHVPIFHGLLRGSHMTRVGIRLPLRPLRFVVAFGVASASFYLVEQPMLRLKERFRSGPPADVALPGSARSSGA